MKLRSPSEKQPWTKQIWFLGNISRASTLSWPVWLNRLATKERLLYQNIRLVSEYCDFYESELEIREHLFFSCHSTGRIQKYSLGRLGMHRDTVSWTSETHWLLQQCGKSMDAVACRLLWTQYIHTIWMERNRCIFYRKHRNDSELSRLIVETVKIKVTTLLRLEHRSRGSHVVTLLDIACI